MSESGILGEFEPTSFRRKISIRKSSSGIPTKADCSLNGHGLFRHFDTEIPADDPPHYADGSALLDVIFREGVTEPEASFRDDAREYGLPLEITALYPMSFRKWLVEMLEETEKDGLPLTFLGGGLTTFESPQASAGRMANGTFQTVWLCAGRRYLQRAPTDSKASPT